jgi:hypothetical protein
MISSFFEFVISQKIFPEELYELVFQFAYDTKSSEIDVRQMTCFGVAKRLPIPRNWSNYLIFKPTEGYNAYPVFNYAYFLDNVQNCPFSLTSHINLKAVRNTVAMLHWPVIKKTFNPFFHWTFRITKKDVLRMLEEWNSTSTEYVYFLQRMIPLLNNKHFLKKSSLLDRIQGLYLRGTDPFGLYLRPPLNRFKLDL